MNSSQELTENNNQESIKQNDLRILVAEDNPTNQFLLQTILERQGIYPTVVNNGAEAIDAIEKQEFDLVFMDMRMPVLDGVEATWSIRNKLKITELPIIALTANTSDKDRKSCLEAGMNDFVIKPFKPQDLFKVINKFMHKAEQGDKLVDINKLNEATFNDTTFKLKMIDIFITENKKRCKNLKTCCDKREIESIKSIAHSIKPALHHLSTSEMATLASEIENETIEDEKTYIDKVRQFIVKLESLIAELELISQNEKN